MNEKEENMYEKQIETDVLEVKEEKEEEKIGTEAEYDDPLIIEIKSEPETEV